MAVHREFVSTVLLLITGGTNAFFVASPLAARIHTSSHLMSMPNVPPPPPVIEQIVSSPVSNIQQSQLVSWSNNNNNIPSHFLLADASSKSNPATPKSTNTASTSTITISDIHYNGDVPKTEADEYVVIKNSSTTPINVSGYYVYVATTGTQGATYNFPKGTTIKPGVSVRIYTNEIHKDTGGFAFGSGKAIWSNNGGLGVLKDNNGKKLMEYKYKPN